MQWKATVLFVLGLAATWDVFANSQQMPWPASSGVRDYKRTTGSVNEAMDMAGQVGNSFLNNIFNSTNRPDWLTRTDVSFAIQKHTKPVTTIETIQPIFEDQRNTWFWQGRIAYTDIVPVANLGLGYRYLTNNKQWMWGINAFYDETLRYTHKRAGLGGELYTPHFTLRANCYDALSGKRYINSNVTEQAVNGYDFGIETPVPYISWMRFNAEGYHWQGRRSVSSVNGGAATLRIYPARQVEANVGYAYDNNNKTQTFLNLAYYLGSPDFVQYSATTAKSNAVFAPRDLEKMRLEKVRRHNDIVVQTEKGVSGQGIIIARGT